MNIVFGVVKSNATASSKSLNAFNQYVRKHHHQRITTHTDRKSTTQLATTTTGGKVLGTAQQNGVTLILNGFLYSPLPKWQIASSPLDDPDTAATYLLDRYTEMGTGFVSDIYGHFSAIIYDSHSDTVHIVRDPSGQNDLFYHQDSEGIMFSNKVRVLAECADKQQPLDRTYEDFFLIYGFYPDGRTMYKDVVLVPKNTILTIHDQQISTRAVKHTKRPRSTIANDEEVLIEKLHKSLSDATKDILPSHEKKVAVLLGGFDSALVAALLKEQGKEVETFSFYYDDEKFNQNHTDTVAKYLGIKHHWIKVDAEVFKKFLNEFSLTFNFPTNWPSYVMQTAYLCAEIRKRGFNYCYTGDGCDSLFYGFPITFKRAQLMSTIGALPNPILTAMIKLAERPTLERYFGRPYQVGLGTLRSAKRNEAERTFLTFRIFDELSLKQLRTDTPPKQIVPSEEIVSSLVKEYQDISPIRLAYEGKNKVAPSRNKLNGSADLSGLVIMSPYTHHKVKEFVKNIPDELLRPSGDASPIGKYILSKMAETKGLLPKSVIYQPKMAASDSPLQTWYSDIIRSYIDDTLDDLPFAYSKKYVESLIRETSAERLYSRLMSKDTNNIMSLAHCLSLLLTYARFTKLQRSDR